ncbi:MAG TPA: hypothetical protein VMH77_00225 [Steroidobacteraceae bacterium]|nr:hypothetical protein [Steroidobacteraceae bacterium]
MAYFSNKTVRYNFWLANGSPDFGLISGGVTGITDQTFPIRLQRGDLTFGATHIEQKHANWVRLQGLAAPELVWRKCCQPGLIYTSEEPEKGKIWMPISPAALMLLRFRPREQFWTVVTLYFHEGALDGELVGKYQDTLAARPAALVFTIRDLPTAPKIFYKKRRWPHDPEDHKP